MTSTRRPRPPRLTRREALLFEAGIKLGGIFHQYLGIPLSDRTAGALARTIETAVGLQPFVHEVRVRIDPRRGGPLGRGRFGYRYLTPEMLSVRVHLTDGATEVEVSLRHRPDLRYPLMEVVRVSEHPGRGGAPRRRSAPATARSRPRRRRPSSSA